MASRGTRPLPPRRPTPISKELKRVPRSPNLEIFVERHGGGKAERFTLTGGVKTRTACATICGARGSDDRNCVDGLHRSFDGSTSPIRTRVYTMLVLWGHAYRFAIAHSQTQSGIDALDFAELAAVLDEFQEQKRKQVVAAGGDPSKTPKLDIVAFDACSLATIETACQLAPYARFLIASEVGVPLPGWPYFSILERLAKPEGDRIMGPAELGSVRGPPILRVLSRARSTGHTVPYQSEPFGRPRSAHGEAGACACRGHG